MSSFTFSYISEQAPFVMKLQALTSTHNLSIATHPEGFWDVHPCTRTPLCDAEQVGTPRSERVLWIGRLGNRRCVLLVCRRNRTEPADSRTGWNRARTGPRDSCSTCSLDMTETQNYLKCVVI